MTLQEARELVGLSRDKLATMAGTTTTNIYDIEAGRNANPSHQLVMRIVRALQRAGLRKLSADQVFPVAEAPEVTK